MQAITRHRFLTLVTALFVGASATSLWAARYNPVILAQIKFLRDASQDLCAEYKRDAKYYGHCDEKLMRVIDEVMRDAAGLSKDLHNAKPLKEMEKCVKRMDRNMVELRKRSSTAQMSRATRHALEDTFEGFVDFRRHYEFKAYPTPNEELSSK